VSCMVLLSYSYLLANVLTTEILSEVNRCSIYGMLIPWNFDTESVMLAIEIVLKSIQMVVARVLVPSSLYIESHPSSAEILPGVV
jgi:hypothetical protein